MKVIVIGNVAEHAAIEKLFLPDAQLVFCDEYPENDQIWKAVDMVFDFQFGLFVEPQEVYGNKPEMFLFVPAITATLIEKSLMIAGLPHLLVGFNSLPFFVDTPPLEISFLSDTDRERFLSKQKPITFPFEIVEDRVGMVRPRVICMIINEAFYTVMEKTASPADIDLGMKLGTNYPLGPFEFLEKIGIEHVYDVLDALYEDTKDERYKICPLLKREYLRFIQGQIE